MAWLSYPLIKPETIEERAYQVNIAKSCIERSTLVVLPTGLGKTVIALIAVADALEKGTRKALLLAPTKPLVEQHAAFFREHLLIPPEQCVDFTGEVPPAKRAALWATGRMVVSTPQVVENDLIAGRIVLNEVGYLVFDEAHRATGNYSYVFVAEKFREHSPAGRTMGMTASPGSRAERIVETCVALGIQGVEIRNEADADVMPYVQEIGFRWVAVDMGEDIRRIRDILKACLARYIDMLRGFGLVRKGSAISTKELLAARGMIQKRMATSPQRIHSLYHAMSAQACAMKVNHAVELAETQMVGALSAYFDRMLEEGKSSSASKATKTVLNDPDFIKAMLLTKRTGLSGTEHPKLEKSVAILTEQFTRKPDSRVIVFTQYRDTSELVVNRLSEVGGIRPVRFVGQATKGADRGLSQKEQVDLIRRFKEGEFNVMVATSVAEEGLDIPETDMVLFYEPVPSEIRTIQRRGRTGRRRTGTVVILMTKGTRDEAYYWSSRGKERKMRSELGKMRRKLRESLVVTALGGNDEPPGPAQGPAPPEVPGTEATPEKPAGAQQTLPEDYAVKRPGEDGQPDSPIKIVVDSREFNSAVVKELSLMGLAVESQSLPIGDYIISERVAVERKATRDFVSSLMDGRLFGQARALARSYLRPIMILEGEDLFTVSAMDPAAVHAALAALLAGFGISVVTTSGPGETARLLHALIRRENDEGRLPRVRYGKPGTGMPERQRFVAEGLPGVSGALSRRLLSRLGSPRAVMAASEEELAGVRGVGRKRAKEIARLLDTPYTEEQ